MVCQVLKWVTVSIFLYIWQTICPFVCTSLIKQLEIGSINSKDIHVSEMFRKMLNVMFLIWHFPFHINVVLTVIHFLVNWWKVVLFQLFPDCNSTIYFKWPNWEFIFVFLSTIDENQFNSNVSITVDDIHL